jgi:predicted ATPase
VYVRALAINEFKAYAHVDVPLEPLTLILGPNGSGKTSVLQAFELVTGLVHSTVKDVLARREWDYSDLAHLKSKGKQFGFELSFSPSPLAWNIKLGHKRGPGIASESVRLGDKPLLTRSWRQMSRLDDSTGENESIAQTLTQSWLSAVTEEDGDRFPDLLEVANWARRVVGYVELQPAALRGASRRTSDGVGRDGGSLAGFLAFLRDRHPDQFQMVLDDVRAAYPRLVGVEVRTARAGWNRIEVTERWGKRTLPFNSRQVSDGLLRLLAVAAMAHSPDQPSLVMIDEVENGLHPHLLGALVGLLQKLADSGTQVIATTHSPVALNYVRDASQVIIASRSEDTGEAQLTPLSRSVAYRRVASAMDPGEAWYNLGEERLLRSLTSGD